MVRASTEAPETNCKRVWVQNVIVNAQLLEARLDAAAARRAESKKADRSADEFDLAVRKLLDTAQKTAIRDDRILGRLVNWWRGTLIEGAYQNLHAAEALIVGTYGKDEVEAELPEAVARIARSLDHDDPRRQVIAGLNSELVEQDLPRARAVLSKAIEVGHATGDHEHSRLRNFRSAVLIATAVLAVFVFGFVMFVRANPTDVPLCFTPTPEGDNPAMLVCPTGDYLLDPPTGGPRAADVTVVAMLGLMGAALAAAIAIRKLRAKPTPYDVPFALAFLKLPVGALTAIGGLLVLRGEFIPGLSELDSQGQILAYALALGYAQELLTRYVDQRASDLLSSATRKETGTTRPEGDWPIPQRPRRDEDWRRDREDVTADNSPAKQTPAAPTGSEHSH